VTLSNPIFIFIVFSRENHLASAYVLMEISVIVVVLALAHVHRAEEAATTTDKTFIKLTRSSSICFNFKKGMIIRMFA